ncbi:MAG: EAL domain-containing protein [Pseudomonadota bacterium]|nr:EAL domain-containing protein [Pseudomonadota bacterium]
MSETNPHVLIVDDEPTMLTSARRTLITAGFRVTTASRAEDALLILAQGEVDAVLTDIQMPGIDGIAFLRAIRAFDTELPVVLMTGDPQLDSAILAVEHGAAQYLVKPLGAEQLRAGLRRATQLGALTRARRRAFELVGGPPATDTGHEAIFDLALEGMWPAFQPIVRWPAGTVYAYEALLRTRQPGFSGPVPVLATAERLGRVVDVGRRMRTLVAEAAATLPGDALLFVNLHAADLLDDDLYDRRAPLSRIAGRVVLEITERASLDDVEDVALCARRLRGLGFRIAVDDLGAGYAGLSSLVLLEPEVVKLDISLIRGVDHDIARYHVVRSMAELSNQLGMQVVAEGIETASERDALAGLGCGLMQGFWFAPPGPGWPALR